MRVLFAGNGPVAARALEVIRAHGDRVEALLLHPAERRVAGEEMIELAAVSPERCFDGSRLREPDVTRAITALEPDIGVSVMFGYIVRPELLAVPPAGFVNVHTSLLPYNRGAYPNVWSIVEGTPAGVTIHYMDEGVDTGDVIAQRAVAVEPVDTGLTLQRRLTEAAVALFRDCWPAIRQGRITRSVQPAGGSAHTVSDVALVDEIELDRTYTARELIDILRARTFPPHPGAYFRAGKGGRKVYMELALRWEEE